MTAPAAIDIATSVERTDAPFGRSGEAVNVTIDPDRYLHELEANTTTIRYDERNRISALVAVKHERR